MATNFFFNNFQSSQEQLLLENLIIEAIKIYGHDVFYIPRKINNYDEVYGADDQSSYEKAIPIEMYIKSVDGFGGNGDFMSKFGIEIRNQVVFSMAQRIFNEEVGTLTTQVRPNEGDLLYVPLTKALYEIKFVQRISPFFQLGKIYFYTITAEIYEIGDDDINTGVEQIDEIELLFSSAIGLVMNTGGIGDFTTGELVTANPGNITAKVKSWNPTNRTLQLVDRTGDFKEGDTITGDDSGAMWQIGSFDSLNNTNNDYDKNREIENAADNLIDWAEKNPFGEYGNFTGSI